jgi:feruloyl esterase
MITHMTKRLLVCGALAVAPMLATNPMLAASCESLASLKLSGTTITMAQVVAAGAFSRPQVGASISEQAFTNPVAFCRVAATLTPSSASEIKIEVWLPISGWNGKFEAVGNGGWAGMFNYPWMSDAVGRGYATSSTDTGHVGDTGSFAFGHPDKVIDFAYRSEHEMTLKAKSIIETFYGNVPQLSYWNGCSTGGRQAVTEAERFPSDYDGIVAGASGIYQMELHAVRVALNVFVHRASDSYIPPDKYPMIHRAALDACDALDGVKDGVIEDPTRCHFDPKVLVCHGPDAPSCLTAAQVETARGLYAPIKNPSTGAVVSAPLLQPGSELGWAALAGSEPHGNALQALKYLVFKDPNWDWHQFNVSTDIERSLKTDNNILNLTDPNLKPFFDHGGKLLMYHGWADPQVTPLNSVRYFNEVLKTVGNAAKGTSIQLYMMPGMNHCRGGAGPDSFDMMGAMEEWVRTGNASDHIVATHRKAGTVDRTRPLCPYPQVAAYKGTGSTDDAANFLCEAP